MDYAARTVRDRAVDGTESLLRLRGPIAQTEDGQTNQDVPRHIFHRDLPLELDSTNQYLPMDVSQTRHANRVPPVDNPWLPRQVCESMATASMQVKSKIRMPWIQKSASGLREKKKYP